MSSCTNEHLRHLKFSAQTDEVAQPESKITFIYFPTAILSNIHINSISTKVKGHVWESQHAPVLLHNLQASLGTSSFSL